MINFFLEFDEIEINDTDDEGKTPLHEAVWNESKRGHYCAERLLRLDADASVRDRNGKTPLTDAASHGRDDLIGVLLQSGAQIDDLDGTGTNALHWAAVHGDLAFVKALIARGASIEAVAFDGRTALHFAAVWDEVEVVELLVVEYGADIDKQEHDGRTPLIVAAQYGQFNAVERLCKLGANVHVRDHGINLLWSMLKKMSRRITLQSLSCLFRRLTDPNSTLRPLPATHLADRCPITR
jgi:ankyrin repeat protein